MSKALRLHDLRHTCNTLTAATGASTRELMHRMGHASARAALRYQHATRDRDEVIAAALSDLIEAGPAKVSSKLDSLRASRHFARPSGSDADGSGSEDRTRSCDAKEGVKP